METQLIKNFFRGRYFLTGTGTYCIDLKKIEIVFFKINFYFSFKVDNITPDQGLDRNWAKIQDPDPNSPYLDTQHLTHTVRYQTNVKLKLV